jgi:uncharacterized BrkB/YihY/UPF0761 family membrane protein
MDANTTVAIFLAVVAKSLVDAIAAPIRQKFPDLDLWWLIYVAWLVGGGLSYACGVNLFLVVVPQMPALVGVVLTAVLVGGGATLINQVFSNIGKNAT